MKGQNSYDDDALKLQGQIDIVIPWVDNTDLSWVAEKSKYEPNMQLPESGDQRYRDWGLLRFLFRGIEQMMPWIRKVHFVTCGHIPKWMNENCERLHVVRHEEFIPGEYLPTFSIRPIELNFHRIPGLSERFIYFNDDMFVVKEVVPEDFFKNGKPRDTAALHIHCYALSRPIDMTAVRDLGVINEHFAFHESVKDNWKKWITPKNGAALLRTLPLLGSPRFPGFYQTHCAQSLLKSTYEEIWAKEKQVLHETCCNKFRTLTDVNQWVLREWQIASGCFESRGKNFSKAYFLDHAKDPVKESKRIIRDMKFGKYPLICINDGEIERAALEQSMQVLQNGFKKAFPQKSSFEK